MFRCSIWPNLHNSMDCSRPGIPVHHQLLELAQTHAHRVSDATQPSDPLLPPSPPALNLSQHHSLFQWVSSLHQVAKGLELQDESFQWIFRVDFLSDWLVWSSCCPRDSQESSPTPQFQKHQFFLQFKSSSSFYKYLYVNSFLIFLWYSTQMELQMKECKPWYTRPVCSYRI